MLVASAALAAAQTSSPKVGVAVKFGVLGAGVDVAVPVRDKLNIHGGFTPSASATSLKTTALRSMQH